MARGVSVIIDAPQTLPSGLYDAVRVELHEKHRIELIKLDSIAFKSSSPAAYLLREFVDDFRADWICNSRAVAEHADLYGLAFWLENLCPLSWQAWYDFLSEYSHIAKSQEAITRLRFAVLVNELNRKLPESDICLTVHRWTHCVSWIDMAVYASRLIADRVLSNLESEIMISVISSLALWDAQLCQRLCEDSQSLDDVLEPHSVLREYCAELGWSEEAVDSSDLWRRGIENMVDGRRMLHSAYLFAKGNTREINRRIWKGQLRCLFPFVEERRQNLVRSLSSAGVLEVPFKERYGKKITAAHDLEIAHIELLLRKSHLSGSQVHAFAKQLRDIRNRLAHNEIVGSHELDFTSFQEFL